MLKPESLAPIVVFAYNRADHLRKTYDSLSKNILADQTDLIVFSDGAKNREDARSVNEVREFLEEIQGYGDFRSIEVFESKENKGLAKSIIGGVSSVIKKYHKIIVLEDDVVTSSYFLLYMNDILRSYEHNLDIGSAASYVPPHIRIPKNYNHPVFVSMRPSSMAWATWENRWTTTDFDVKNYSIQKFNFCLRRKLNSWGNDVAGRLDRYMAGHNNSWAVRFTVSRIKQNQYAVHPNQSLVRNIGLDQSGTNSMISDFNKFNIDKVYERRVEVPNQAPIWDTEIRDAYRQKYRRNAFSSIGEFLVVAVFGCKKGSLLVRWAKKISSLIKSGDE